VGPAASSRHLIRIEADRAGECSARLPVFDNRQFSLFPFALLSTCPDARGDGRSALTLPKADVDIMSRPFVIAAERDTSMPIPFVGE